MNETHREHVLSTGKDERTELARLRTRMANNRTFLAWCRTALAVMGVGVLLEKIGLLMDGHISTLQKQELGSMGLVALIAGPVLIFFAGWRYLRMSNRIGGGDSIYYIFPELFVFVVAVAFVMLSV